MRVYLVISAVPNDSQLKDAVEAKYRDAYQLVRDGVWFVRTKEQTTNSVLKTLGVDGELSALVVRARYVSGWYESEVIEQLDAWDEGTS